MFFERIHKLLQLQLLPFWVGEVGASLPCWAFHESILGQGHKNSPVGFMPIPDLPGLVNIAIENGPIEIVDLPINRMVDLSTVMLVYQRVFQEALLIFMWGCHLQWICDLSALGSPPKEKKNDAFLIFPRSLVQHPITSPSYSKTNCFANITILVFQTQIFQNSHDWHVWSRSFPL